MTVEKCDFEYGEQNLPLCQLSISVIPYWEAHDVVTMQTGSFSQSIFRIVDSPSVRMQTFDWPTDWKPEECPSPGNLANFRTATRQRGHKCHLARPQVGSQRLAGPCKSSGKQMGVVLKGHTARLICMQSPSPVFILHWRSITFRFWWVSK